MPQNSFQKLRILVVLKRQYKIVLKLHKNARFKTAFLSNFVTKIHNFCYNNPLFCIFETIFGRLIRYKGTPRNISTDGRMDGPMDGWTDGRKDGRMDGQTDGRTDGSTDEQIH